MKTDRIVVWFREDLRLHDHEALTKAMDGTKAVFPVYIFDDRQFAEDRWGFEKTGPFRAQFLLESLQNLRASLREKGSELIIRRGLPEEILPALCEELGAGCIYAHKAATPEEEFVEQKLEEAVFPMGYCLNFFWGSTLYHLEDLPMPISSFPEVFTQYRKSVEKTIAVRTVFDTPRLIPTPKIEQPGELPSLADLGLREPTRDPRSVLSYQGGESAGFRRLEKYFWEQDLLRTYKETRNGLIGADYSSKFSAWLSLGCLSPRYIHEEVRRYEQERVRNRSTYWLIFELMWRDFFRFIARKHGNSLFHKGGINATHGTGPIDWERFERWQRGQTGNPFVDANMRELNSTGYMSNRGRQNVASFLVNDLGLDWRMGAAWFESRLIDYDPCSNYGNWNYVAGVGNDPRENRYFNTVSQAKRYDPQADYLRLWVPELAKLPAPFIFEPWSSPKNVLEEAGIRLDRDYPRLMLQPRRV